MGYYFVDEFNNVLATGHTDMTKSYDEDVLVYCNCWGGLNPNILNYITFKKCILNVYNERISKLTNEFISIHMRNTDIQTHDILCFLNTINDKILNSCVFLARDNKTDIDFVKNLYGNNINTFAKITDKTLLTIDEVIIDCLVDLLMLASGKEIYYSCKNSGYSRLAEYLCNNKKILQKMLL